ncbi:MAG: hypothetical protein AAFY47_05310 [Pseudomonadota bacterium]
MFVTALLVASILVNIGLYVMCVISGLRLIEDLRAAKFTFRWTTVLRLGGEWVGFAVGFSQIYAREKDHAGWHAMVCGVVVSVGAATLMVLLHLKYLVVGEFSILDATVTWSFAFAHYLSAISGTLFHVSAAAALKNNSELLN